MSVSNGQDADQDTYNNAFMSRDTDTNTTGQVDLDNTDAASGPTIANAQRSLNGVHNFVGSAPEGAQNQDPSWTSDALTGTVANESVKDRVDAVQAAVETLDSDKADLNPGSATDANRFTLPRETAAAISALTRREATLFYDNDKDKPVFDDGGSLIELASVDDITASGGNNEPSQLVNLGLSTSVASSALTIELKQSDGSTDPSTGDQAVKIAFRSSTTTNGGFNVRQATSATSIVVSSGSTLGHSNNATEFIYVYAIDNSGTVELAVSSSFYGESGLISTTAEGGAGAADSATAIYSTVARTNVPIRLIGRLQSLQTTAGTWASVPSIASTNWSPRYTLGSKQVFTSSGTWTRPSGCLAVVAEVVGGGGGGGGAEATGATESAAGSGGGGGGYSRKLITIGMGSSETVTIGSGGAGGSGPSNGSSGGTTSFGSHCSATGGQGGGSGGATSGTGGSGQGGNGGSGSSGDLNIDGQGGGSGFRSGTSGVTVGLSGAGGSSVFGGGGAGRSSTGAQGGFNGGNYGGGGSGAVGVTSTSAQDGGAGADGVVIVWEFY